VLLSVTLCAAMVGVASGPAPAPTAAVGCVSRCVMSATFPGGLPPQSPGADEGSLRFEVGTGAGGARKKKLMLRAKWGGGVCEGRVGEQGALAKYVVGVYSKSSGTLELFDSRQVVPLRYTVTDRHASDDDADLSYLERRCVVSPADRVAVSVPRPSTAARTQRTRAVTRHELYMLPCLRAPVAAAVACRRSVTQRSCVWGLWGCRKMLIETFGSRKKQRAQAAKEANTIGADMIYGAAVVSRQLVRDGEKIAAAAAANASTDAGASVAVLAEHVVARGCAFHFSHTRAHSCVSGAVEEATMAARMENLPGFNPHAASVEHVYPLECVMPPSVAKALKTEAADVIKAAGKADSITEMRRYCETSTAIAARAVVARADSACGPFCVRSTGLWPEFVLDIISRGRNALKVASSSAEEGGTSG
jgi:hypothetical protein